MKKLFNIQVTDDEFDFLMCEQSKGKELVVENNKVIARERMLTQQELNKQRIAELKAKLTATDYKAIKFAEGQMSELEYAPIKEQRQKWRDEINVLEQSL